MEKLVLGPLGFSEDDIKRTHLYKELAELVKFRTVRARSI